MASEILTYLRDKEEEIVRDLQALVEMETPSKEKAHTDKAAAYLQERFEALTGGKARLLKNETYGDHVRGEWGEGDGQILLLAHFDTVFPLGTLAKNPFRIDAEGRMHGPGVFDTKGGLVLGLYALHAMQALGVKPDKQVVFLMNSDEEIGSLSSRPLIEAEAKRSDAAIILECAGPDGKLKTSRKGVGVYDLYIGGHAVHAGIDHQSGRSAIEELARQIQYLHSLTDYERGSTVNVGVVTGGSARNVVAAEAAAQIDLRVTSRQEAQRMHEAILALKPQTEGTTVRVEGQINRMPMERDARMAQFYEFVRKLGEEKLGLELGEVATGGASDGNFTACFCPTIDGMGIPGAGAHAMEEYAERRGLAERAALIAEVVRNLI